MVNLNMGIRKNSPQKNIPKKQGMAKANTPQKGTPPNKLQQKPVFGGNLSKTNQKGQSIVQVKEESIDDVQIKHEESDSVDEVSEGESDEVEVPSDIDDLDVDAEESGESNEEEIDMSEEEIGISDNEVDMSEEEIEMSEEESDDKNEDSDGVQVIQLNGKAAIDNKASNSDFIMLNKKTTIQVSNINLTTTEQELKDKFSHYGSIEFMWLRKTELVLPSGSKVVAIEMSNLLYENASYTAFICYKTSSSVEEAIKGENGKVFNEMHLWVMRWTEPEYRIPESTVFVEHRFNSQIYEDVYSALISYGEIAFIHFKTSFCNGDVFFNAQVTFKTPEVVDKVVNDRNIVIKHVSCTVHRSRPFKAQHKIFVSGLRVDEPAEEVKKSFSAFGEILGFVMGPGTCEINYATPGQVEKALKADVILSSKKLKITKFRQTPTDYIINRPFGVPFNQPGRGRFNAKRPPRGFGRYNNSHNRGRFRNAPIRGRVHKAYQKRT